MKFWTLLLFPILFQFAKLKVSKLTSNVGDINLIKKLDDKILNYTILLNYNILI